jgi:hypothetical protein
MDFKKTLAASMDRRKLLHNMGLMGAGAVLAACSPRGVATPPPDDAPRNVDAAILNFALNLEYLEAAFYLAAVGRLELLPGDADIILPEGVEGSNPSANWDTETRDFAEELAQDELDHVLFLRTALGDILEAPIADRPVMDFRDSFRAAVQAAFEVDEETAAMFDPYANELFFLHGTFVFEDVGVTAYNGAAPLVTDREIVLQNAAGILAVEAYHSGSVRTRLYQQRDVMTPFGLSVSEVVQGISDLRAAVGGGKDQGILQQQDRTIVRAGRGNIVAADDNGVAFARTPREVANIVYLNAQATPGGFFPNGITVPAGLEDDFNFLLGL